MYSLPNRACNHLILPLLAIFVLSACSVEQADVRRKTSATPAPVGFARRGSPPTQSGNRIDLPVSKTKGWWTERHELLNSRALEGNYDLVFIGDSITHRWESTGQTVWEEYYADRRALNLGIDGDGTQHVLWRLEHGNIDGLVPKVAVLLIGTNNWHNTAPEIAAGTTAIVLKLRETMPGTQVLILGIFPRFEEPHPTRDKLAEASALVAKITDDEYIHYLDIGEQFLDEAERLDPSIMPDYLHPSEKGYRIWAESIEDTVSELLGE